MIKYCFITDEEKGLVQLGAGCSNEYYEKIGMKQRDVEESEVDFQWYLVEKCPHYTPEEKLQNAKEEKLREANKEANRFLDYVATFEFNPNYHIEATKENMTTFAIAGMAIEKGLIPYQEWTSKEDNKRNNTMEDCFTISGGIRLIQDNVWNIQYVSYSNRINNATTVKEVEAIEIVYE